MSSPRKVNVRRPDVMQKVEAQVTTHYNSPLVNQLRACGSTITAGTTTIRLAQEFGFCYGVERAINLAYATREVFPNQKIFLIGEIIHNPEVNRQLDDMGILRLPWQSLDASYDQLTPDDVVLVPAFGAPTHFMEKLSQTGVTVIDTTCGDVMKVWRRVRDYAARGFTSIIHGKANHEETQATASRALGDSGAGHYLIILTREECQQVCDFIVHGGDPKAFLAKFQGAHSPDFDPQRDLARIGVANQTTMLKSETESFQIMLREAVEQRDNGDDSNFLVFDTICGATQERQDALFKLLESKPDILLVIGGYNSSNTTHLVEIGEQHLPTFFIRDASCLESFEQVLHYDLKLKEESRDSSGFNLDPARPVNIGITAGASCPANLIEDTIVRILALRGVPQSVWQAAIDARLPKL